MILLRYCYQVAYIQFLRGGASNDYPGLLIVYILISRNCSRELSLMTLTDGYRKVTTAPNKSIPKHINELVLLTIKACPLAFGRLFRS
jgi:hypothetical protein